MKRNIITICGVLGSGKSTTAKRVASTLGYAHYSGGDFMRAMATERGITLAELNILAETDPAIDKEIDRKQKEFMDANENFVIDSRLGWFWAPNSFKVFLNLPVSVSSQRVFADMQAKKSERANEVQKAPETFEEVEARLAERFASEGERYKKYYDIDNYQDSKHFDLVIDTSVNDIPTVEKLVIEGYKKWQAEKTEK